MSPVGGLERAVRRLDVSDELLEMLKVTKIDTVLPIHRSTDVAVEGSILPGARSAVARGGPGEGRGKERNQGACAA